MSDGTSVAGVSATREVDVRTARHVLAASFLAWMLDACDFFIVLFTLDNVADGFGVPLEDVLWAPTLTLMTRPIGAFLCGRSADRFGRKPTLICTIVVYSLIEVMSAFSPSIGVFLACRALFGVALGGVWGVGTSLVMESVPKSWRGMASGLLQAGYPAGYLLASLMFLLLPVLGWRGLFILGGVAIVSAIYVGLRVPESPEWLARSRTEKPVGLWTVVRGHMALSAFAVAVMTMFNFMSHGSQDLYPKLFLAIERHIPHDHVTMIVVCYNIAAISGGLFFGWLSQRLGRSRTIMLAALLVLPILPLWTLPHSLLWLTVGAVCIQFCIQGAWGVVPAYLSELSPASVRATFPGVAYQLGNLIAASNALIQHHLAGVFGKGLPPALMLVVGGASLTLFLLLMVDARIGLSVRKAVGE